MIQFKSVTKKYPGEIEALSDVSFEVEPGEFLFLVGPSGSGKTTIIKLLIREENPSAGKVYFDDDDITRYNRNKIYHLRRKIGVIFQDFKLIPELTAYENVAFAMEAAGRSEAEIKENVPYLLDIVGLSKRAQFFPRMLSGGEQQRVAIARAMANNPKLLIADEPTGNLDPDSAWDIVQILSKINNWGTTVIMSTHGFDIVNTLHKRVIRLEGGKIVRDDLKGSYDNVDEFSLKIISAQGKANKNADAAKKGEEEAARNQDKLKQESNKKIKISTKKNKVEVQLKPEVAAETKATTKKANDSDADDHPVEKEDFSNKILADLETKLGKETETEVVSEATVDAIRKLKLPEAIKQKLIDLDYHNLDEVIEAGIEKLDESGEFKKDELKVISDFIDKFIKEIEKNEVNNKS